MTASSMWDGREDSGVACFSTALVRQWQPLPEGEFCGRARLRFRPRRLRRRVLQPATNFCSRRTSHLKAPAMLHNS